VLLRLDAIEVVKITKNSESISCFQDAIPLCVLHSAVWVCPSIWPSCFYVSVSAYFSAGPIWLCESVCLEVCCQYLCG